MLLSRYVRSINVSELFHTEYNSYISHDWLSYLSVADEATYVWIDQLQFEILEKSIQPYGFILSFYFEFANPKNY